MTRNLSVTFLDCWTDSDFDKAAFHKSDKTQQLVKSAKCHLLFLPSYSPDLNKIEHQWAVLKQGIRAKQDTELMPIQKIDQQLIQMSDP